MLSEVQPERAKKKPASWIRCRSHAEIREIHVVIEESTLNLVHPASTKTMASRVAACAIVTQKETEMKPLETE